MQRLVPTQRWIRASRTLERDEALAEFVTRYLRGRGPATVRDFAGWSKLTLTDSRRGLEIARADGRVAPFDADAGLWSTADAETTAATATTAASATTADAGRRAFTASIHLLPGFDEYYLGYTDRGPIIDPANEDAVVPGRNGVFQPTMVAAGRVIGTWRRRSSRAGVGVEVRPFDGRPPSASRMKAIERSAAAYAAFLGQSHVRSQ